MTQFRPERRELEGEEKSAIAKHHIYNGHSIKENEIKLLKLVHNHKNAWESTYQFYHNEFLVKNENVPIQNPTLLPYITLK